jgi:hypothetical protein
MCEETDRYPAGRYSVPDLPDTLLPIQVDEIDRELHSEGMYTFARNDPQTFSRRKRLTIEKTSSSFRAVVSYTCAVGQFRLSSKIGNPKRHGWFR